MVWPELHVTRVGCPVPLAFPASHTIQVSAEVADGVELRVYLGVSHVSSFLEQTRPSQVSPVLSYCTIRAGTVVEGVAERSGRTHFAFAGRLSELARYADVPIMISISCCTF